MFKFLKVKTFRVDGNLVIFNGHDLSLRFHPLKSIDTNANDILNYIKFFEWKSCLLDKSSNIDNNLFPYRKIISKPVTPSQSINQRSQIQRLTINVSNICNMNCRYCYANGGKYYGYDKLMDKNTVVDTINFVADNFSEVNHVNFFGGEPTLNLPIIRLFCNSFFELYSQGIISSLPTFGLTTNGYVISNDLLDLIKEYSFRITLSLDGPSEIHDYLRKTKNGLSTFNAIKNNVEILIDLGIVPEFECTYTYEHWRKGIDIVMLMDFFYNNFKCHTLHCPLVVVDRNNPLFVSFELALKLYSDAIRYSISNFKNNVPLSISLVTRLLNAMIMKEPILYYCSAGKSSLTINADGNVFACFMLMLGEGYCLGNVNGISKSFGHPDLITSLLDESNKLNNSVCCNCWAQSLCFGCLGEDIVRERTSINRSLMSGTSASCDLKRKLIESFLKSIVKMYLD